jgi:hypothetical protein
MGTVEKKIIRFGQRGAGGSANEGSWSGLPTEMLDVGASHISDVAYIGTINRRETTTLSLMSGGGGGEPVSAISIAPDSPIAEVDLYINGGASAHRVGVGCPFIGTLPPGTRIDVAPVQPIPALFHVRPGATMNSREYGLYVVPWEMAAIERQGGSDNIHPLVPVKLNIHRGALSHAILKRAGYHASMSGRIWLDAGTGLNSFPTLIVVTDGRRRVRVRASRSVAAASLTVYGVNGYKTGEQSAFGFADGRVDHPQFDELLATTAIDLVPTGTIFDYTGNPYFAFICTMSGTATARFTLDVSCWDD